MMKRFTNVDRLSVADQALRLLRARYRKRLLAVGLYGSTARDEDGPYSDVELTAIVKGKGFDQRYEGIVRGMKYTVDVSTLDVIRGEITDLHIGWPLFSGIYAAARPLYDPTGVYPRLRRLYERTIRRDFRPAARKEFVASFYERFAKFFNAADHGDSPQMRYLAVYLFNWLLPFMGLINRRALGAATYHPERVLAMPATFPSYRDLGKLILAGNLRDSRRLSRIVRRLYRDIVRHTGATRLLRGAKHLRLGKAGVYE